MLDPRFQERLEFIDERDEEGKPTVRAQIGLKIQGYSEDVERLRISLAELEEEVLKLQSSVEAQALSIAEQESRRTDLITDAQHAPVRAAMSESGGAAARLRRQAQDTRDRIEEFEKDFSAEQARLEQTELTLNAKKTAVKEQRDMIVRRLNTMSSLAVRAGVEFGTEIVTPDKSSQPQRRPAPVRAMRRRPRRVRVRRRRAS